MKILHRIRLFCALDRKAIERATGVSEHRLAKFEAERSQLNKAEERAVISFLRARLKMIAEEEAAGAGDALLRRGSPDQQQRLPIAPKFWRSAERWSRFLRKVVKMKNSKELNEVQPRKRVPFFTHCLICSARIAAVVHGPNFNLDADGRPNWASQHRCPPTNPEKMEGYHAAESDAGGPTSQEVQQRLDEWLTAPTPEDE